MTINRIWFANIPSGSVNAAQRAMIGIGYSSIALAFPTSFKTFNFDIFIGKNIIANLFLTPTSADTIFISKNITDIVNV